MHSDSVQGDWQQVVQGSLLLRRAINSEKSKREKARYQEKLQSRTAGLQVEDGAPLSIPSLVLSAVKTCLACHQYAIKSQQMPDERYGSRGLLECNFTLSAE